MYRPQEGIPPLQIRLKPSLILVALVLAVHAVFAMALWSLPLATGCRLLWLGVILGHGGYCLWRFGSVAYTGRISALLADQRGWVAETSAGPVPVTLRAATVWRGMVVLNFQSPGTRRALHLALLPDSCCRDSWRQLQVLLRHGLVTTQA